MHAIVSLTAYLPTIPAISQPNRLSPSHPSHKSAKLKSSYRREYFSIDGDVDLQMTGPVLKASSVLM